MTPEEILKKYETYVTLNTTPIFLKENVLQAMDEYGKMCFEAAREKALSESVWVENIDEEKFKDYQNFKDSKEGK